MSKILYLKKLLDWGHTVEFEISETDLFFKIKMKSGLSMITGEDKNFWQALARFLGNANFFVTSLKVEEELKPLENMVLPGKKIALALENSSLTVKVNGKPADGALAEALKTALA